MIYVEELEEFILLGLAIFSKEKKMSNDMIAVAIMVGGVVLGLIALLWNIKPQREK